MSVLFVAEIGSGHNRDGALMFELIRQASIAGADIAKFQFGWDWSDRTRYVDPWAADLRDWCDFFGIELMASIWSLHGLETARDVGMRRYKIAAQKADDRALVAEVLADGKPTFISSTRWKGSNVLPLYCVSEYPTYPGLTMPRWFDDFYGYSDHAHGIAVCLTAIARGAKYIEKHLTLDKTQDATRDHRFSATPEEFSEMVRIGREMGAWVNAGL